MCGSLHTLKNYKDVPNRTKECLEKVEFARKDAIYYAGVAKMEEGKKTNNPSAFEEVAARVLVISGHKEADKHLVACEKF